MGEVMEQSEICERKSHRGSIKNERKLGQHPLPMRKGEFELAQILLFYLEVRYALALF